MSYKNWTRKLEGKELIPEEKKNDFDDSRSIAVQEDQMPDGRNCRYEVWSESECTFITYTFPYFGLEGYSKEEIIQYLNSQGFSISLEKFPLDSISLMTRQEDYQLTITIDS